MTRSHLVVLSIVLVAGCFTSHEGQQAVGQDDCGTCHLTQYNQAGTPEFPEHVATAPIHVMSQNCTLAACANCHRTTTWSNSLGGCDHPETALPGTAGSTGFPLRTLGTKHTNIKCIDCHSDEVTAATGATSKLGANTDCTSSVCHPDGASLKQEHTGVTYEAGVLLGQPYAFKPDDHRFCLDCHPQGLAIGHKPGNPFRLPHHGAKCAKCHDNASGLGHADGADVLCVTSGCHDGNGSDRAHHFDTSHNPGCLDAGCHPDGRNHDD